MAKFEKMQMMYKIGCSKLYVNPLDYTVRKTRILIIMSVKQVQNASPDQLLHVQFGPQVK